MQIQDVFLNYEIYGKKDGQPCVFLHGWGQNIEMMKPLAMPFQKDNCLILIDLPGYGKSEEPKTVWSVADYASCIYELLRKLKVTNPILIGHSFGGKISLMYASKYPVKQLILLGSPYCREVTKTSMKTKLLKQMKKIPVLKKLEGFAKRHMGSEDYRNATPRMRDILVQTVNLDLTQEVSKITCPTLLIWGTLDEAVPLKRAYELEKLIADCGVVTYEGASHYAYLEHLSEVISVIRSFIY